MSWDKIKKALKKKEHDNFLFLLLEMQLFAFQLLSFALFGIIIGMIFMFKMVFE
jgi:hypothetical protein